MPRVAYLTAARLCGDQTSDASALHEHRVQLTTLQRACAARGIELQPVVWTDAAFDPRSCDLIVVGMTWDYADCPGDFLERLHVLSAQRPLFNPLPIVRWNLEKTYLRDLAARGIPIVPTLWRERADARDFAGAFDELGTDTIVVKPLVGQHSWRQARLRRGAALPGPETLPPARAMIQPYLPSIETEGELSFVYFDRVFSHCVRKLPAAGDYRIQSSFGGIDQRYEPTAAELDQVDAVLAAVEGPLLQARVDLVRGTDGRWAVIELELIEPYLYPDQGDSVDGMGMRFADALLKEMEPV